MCILGETPRIMSKFTEQKAQNLIDTQSIIQIDDSTYQVRSSAPGKSYMIMDGMCECLGYRFREECSHVQAVKMLQKQSKGPEIVSTS